MICHPIPRQSEKLHQKGNESMGATAVLVACLAYIAGLLVSSIAAANWALLGLGVAMALLVPRLGRLPRSRLMWGVAGAIALGAGFYLHFRTPQPAAQDISRWLVPEAQSTLQQTVTVHGQVESMPRQTRSGKAQFWLAVQAIEPEDAPPLIKPLAKQAATGTQVINKPSTSQQATGKLYVTVPRLQATGVYPGMKLHVTGSLYRPMPAANPGGFDFRQYLAREGCFAGMRGTQVDIPGQTLAGGLWQVQQRIVRSQVIGAGSPAGQLISSMALGKEAVDLPYDIKDAFCGVGLAHALAASGFQISLILGVVLTLTRRMAETIQAAIGALALMGFVLLAGFEPAILRAALMGGAVLLALLLGRKTKPLGVLMLVATGLLLWNPLWIWDLGFQLSFFATLGLLVTVPTLAQQLDWLPPAIGEAIAVPFAAALWTMPLQLHEFGIVSPYSLPLNVVVTPLISILSLGGMASAIGALVWPPLGSALAWVLQFPAGWLIAIVQTTARLPGNLYAVGMISMGLVVALYGLLTLIGFHRWWQRRWWLALALGVGLVVVPAWQVRASSFQASVLAAGKTPLLLIQDAGRTALIAPQGEEQMLDAATIRFTLQPFLDSQGINQVDWAISPSPPQLSPSTGLPSPVPIQSRLAVTRGQAIPFGASQAQLLSAEPNIIRFAFHRRRWLWLDTASVATQETWMHLNLGQTDVLWWPGTKLTPALLKRIQPQVAIASAKQVDSETTQQLGRLGTKLYYTGRDGAVEWARDGGFKTVLNPGDGRD
jgi:competence protein ComEC